MITINNTNIYDLNELCEIINYRQKNSLLQLLDRIGLDYIQIEEDYYFNDSMINTIRKGVEYIRKKDREKRLERQRFLAMPKGRRKCY